MLTNDGSREAKALAVTLLNGLRLQLQSGGEERLKTYYAWLDRKILIPRLAADDGFENEVADQLVQLLKQACHGVPDFQARQELLSVQKMLPAQFRDHKAIRDFLRDIGLRTVVRIKSLIFESDQLYEALNRAQAMGTAVVYAINYPEEPATIGFEPLESPAFRFTHESTGTADDVFDPSWSSVFDDNDVRIAFMNRLGGALGLDETEVMKYSTSLSAMSRTERIVSLRRRLTTSAPAYYRWLYEAIGSDAQLSLKHMLPPDVPAALRLSRLFDVSEAPFLDLAVRAFRALAVNQNPAVGFDLISSLPIAFPSELIEDMQKWNADERRILIKVILREQYAPLAVTNLIRLLMAFKDDVPSYPRLARVLARWLRSDEAQARASAFIHLAKWTSDRLADRPDARALSRSMRIAASWLHANRLLQAFSLRGLDITAVASEFQIGSGLAAGRPFESVSSDVSDPHNVEAVPYLALALAKALQPTSLDSDSTWEREAIRAISVHAEDPNLLDFGLLETSDGYENALGSFLGENRTSTLDRFLGRELLEQLDLSTLDENIEQLLIEPDNLGGWALLGLRLKRNVIPRTHAKRVYDLFIGTKFSDLIMQDEDTGRIALKTATDAAASILDDGLRDHFLTELNLLAKPGKNRAKAGITQLVGFVLQRILDVVNITGSPTRSARDFAAAVRNFALAFEPGWDAIRNIIESLYRRVPLAEARELGPLIIFLRRR